jgi:hypothetical protein
MRQVTRKLLPTSGLAHLLHLVFLLVLPLAVLILVRLQFVQLAVLVIILSKWRMFAVRPRFWAANIRANAVDLMVGIATVIFMVNSDSGLMQLLWTVLYAGWLTYIKPRSDNFMVTVQAFIGQLYALSALYLAWGNGPVVGLTFLTGLFCYLAARHFFDIFDEPYARLLSFIWGYFAASLAWLLSHWLLFYQFVAQPTLILTALGYGLGVLYYLDHNDRLNKGLKNQVVFIMVTIIIVVLAFSDWGNKVV